MIEAVIFDMDGLLIDSEPVWDKARFLMAKEAGVDWNKDDHKAVMGVSTHEWVSYMIDRLSLSMPPKAVEQEIISKMSDIYAQKIPFFPGAIESVAMSSVHFPTGLASGSPRQLIDTVISDPALSGKFKVALSGDEFEKGKPSPDIYLAAAKGLGINPEKCVCLEDSGNGIMAGKNAGMKVIAVPDYRFSPDQEKLVQADIILDSLDQLTLETFSKLD